MNTQMSEARLAELASSYGSSIERWPAAEHDAARDLLQRSAGAREVLVDAARLDRILDGMPAPPAPGAGLRRRILGAAPSAAPAGWAEWMSGLWHELGGVSRAGPMLAASLALGVLLTPFSSPAEADDDPMMLQIALTESDYEEWVP